MRKVAITSGANASDAAFGSASTAAWVRSGSAITGPGWKSKFTPSAGSGLMMSANTMAASKGKRAIGSSVTCAASSGDLESALKSCFARSVWYSGR